jgi:MFS family permease
VPPSRTGGERPAGRFASPLLPIFLIVAVDVLGFTIILPLPPFYSEHLGASPAVVGALVSTYAFCQLIAGPIFAASALSFTSILGTFFLLPRREKIHEYNEAADPGPGGRRLSLISWG